MLYLDNTSFVGKCPMFPPCTNQAVPFDSSTPKRHHLTCLGIRLLSTQGDYLISCSYKILPTLRFRLRRALAPIVCNRLFDAYFLASKVDPKCWRKNIFSPVHHPAFGAVNIGRMHVTICTVTRTRTKNQSLIPPAFLKSACTWSFPMYLTANDAAISQMNSASIVTKGRLSVETENSHATGASPTRRSPSLARQDAPRRNVWERDRGVPPTQENTYRLG